MDARIMSGHDEEGWVAMVPAGPVSRGLENRTAAQRCPGRPGSRLAIRLETALRRV